MRICDLVTGIGRMKRSSSLLKERWMATKLHWNDETSRQFEEDFLGELAPQITLTVATIHRLAELLEQAEKECEEETEEIL